MKTLVYNAFKPVPGVELPLNFGRNRGVVSDQDLVTPIQQLHSSTNHGSYIWARKVTQETVLLCCLALKSTLEAQSMPKCLMPPDDMTLLQWRMLLVRPLKGPAFPSDTSSFLCPGLKDPHSHSQVINTEATCCPTESPRPFRGRPSFTDRQAAWVCDIQFAGHISGTKLPFYALS